ncbi:NAD-P-binding protein [Mycena maculata]|uniref:NAD-P-binding protein n=1 Tax=Mycena maculata TaxID=230809 RepID=A0AAD7H4P9_9AGAR|nr:NAD-P-binding protein [Mycena maculata]
MSQVVLITGCSEGGIGFTMCTEFALRGCKVYATARNVAKMKNLDAAPNIELMALDVTVDTNVVEVVETIVKKEGRIDILINNAGMACFFPVEQIREVLDANVLSIVRVSRAVLPHMAERKSGLIVNIGSIVGEIPTPWAGVYEASKAAAHSISEVLQMECRPFDVKVLLVSPGGIKTNVAQNAATRFALQPDSPYTAYLDCIVKRMWTSQGTSSMTADAFARLVATKVLGPKPPFYMTMGSHSTVFAILKMLPRMWALNLMWKTYATPPKK